MDKFFIQATFKSLDEIDLEENKQIKQALIESRLKEKALREKKKYPLAKDEHLNTCAGNPDINTAAFNHATDVGASSPSTGLGEDNEGKYTVRRYGRYHYIIINPENGLALRVGSNIDYSKPQSPDNKILFFKSKNDAENYIKNNIDDSQILDEKLPKDLAKAYKNTEKSLYADRLSPATSDLSDQDKQQVAAKLSDYNDNTNLSPIDFEKASYQEITKDEAMKYAKPKKVWQLVLVFGVKYPKAIRFDKNGKALNSIEFDWNKGYVTASGRQTFKSTQMPIKELIDRADKIYLTDEQDHLNDNYFENEKRVRSNIENSIALGIPDWELADIYKQENGIYSANYNYKERQSMYDNLKRRLERINRDIKNYLNYLSNTPKESYWYDKYTNYLKEYRNEKNEVLRKMRLLGSLRSKQISPSEYMERREIIDNPDPKNRMSNYNLRLDAIKVLKNNLKNKVEDFNDKSDKYLKGDAYKDEWDYRYYTEKIKELEAQIKEAQDLITQYNTKLSKIDKSAIDDKIADELNASYDLIKKLNSKLTSLGAKSMIKEDVEKNKFNLNDPDDVKEAIERKDHPEKEDDLVIIHPLLNHKKPSPGNAILTCKDCNEVFYFDKNELKQDEEDPTIYNKDIQCENCGAQDGYDYIGDVSLKDTESAKEAEQERNDIEQDDFVDEESKEQPKEPELEPVDDLEEPDEIVEESFDQLANKYFNKIYENISSYKTTGISQEDRNKYLIEGVLTDKNTKEKKVSFLLETLKRNKDKVVLQGSLKELIENKAPFRFCGKITDNKLLFESMRYRYVENINKDKYLIEGLEINK